MSNSVQPYLQFVSDDTVGSKGLQAQYQMISYGYKLPKHQLDSQSLINQIASSTSYSSVYYGKNEMLQQYQPFQGNIYLVPPL
uniref:Uncharacterized protein n=1 Tax=Trichobilharzia regenti TaxID=157069 RepID=A0AA85J2F9_TRIRE|nr:unnamed protein product [Trichobilharzia regenti]